MTACFYSCVCLALIDRVTAREFLVIQTLGRLSKKVNKFMITVYKRTESSRDLTVYYSCSVRAPDSFTYNFDVFALRDLDVLAVAPTCFFLFV